MNLWRVKKVCCDGNRLGQVHEENWFRSKEVAQKWLDNKIREDNDGEIARKRYHALWEWDEVENIGGFCNWQYGIMLILEEVPLPDED